MTFVVPLCCSCSVVIWFKIKLQDCTFCSQDKTHFVSMQLHLYLEWVDVTPASHEECSDNANLRVITLISHGMPNTTERCTVQLTASQ